MISVPVTLFAVDHLGAFTLAEGQDLDALGLLPDAVLGRSVFQISTTRYLREQLRRALAGEALTAIVHRCQRAFQIQYMPLHESNGDIIVIGVAIEVTEPSHLGPLHQSDAPYRLLIEHIPSITYVAALDASSSTLYTSPQIESILGFSQAEWMAEPTLWLQQIHPDDRDGVLAALARSRAGEVAPCEYRMLTRDGRVVWLRDQAALLRDLNGQPRYLYGVMLDISERMQLEAELSETRRRLAESQEAERLRVAGELHDGAVQQLLAISYLLDESQQHIAAGWSVEEQVIAHALTLESIRDQVLDVARQLRSVISELRPAGLDELGLTATLKEYVARLVREHDSAFPLIALDLDQSDTALPAPVALCLFRVAQEALRNTLKHGLAHTIHIKLRLLPSAAILIVSDDGHGFAVPERLKELALEGHYGLVGLAEQVAWLGGRIAVQSQPGAGTTVTVSIELTEM